jgi:hypothetical protein
MVLTRIPMSMRYVLGPYCESQFKTETIAEREADVLAMRFSTELLASQRIKRESIQSFKVPKTWWDHLKESLPSWLAKRLKPVEYAEISLTTNFQELSAYPKIKIRPPQDFGPITTVQISNLVVSNPMGLNIGYLPGQEIPDPYLNKDEVMYALYASPLCENFYSNPINPSHIRRFLDALEDLGVNASEMVRR